jgi:hypothetical protein
LAQHVHIPKDFEVVRNVLKYGPIGNTFDLRSGGKSFGSLNRVFLSVRTTVEHKDASGALVSTGQMTSPPWGNHLEVRDGAGTLIGSLEERLLQSAMSLGTVYAVKDGRGREVAVSKKHELIGTSIVIFQGDKEIARLERAAIRLGRETWKVHITNEQGVDSRLMVHLGAFKSLADEAREVAKKKEEEKRQEEEERRRRQEDERRRQEGH